MQTLQHGVKSAGRIRDSICDNCLSIEVPAGLKVATGVNRQQFAEIGIVAREIGVCSQCGGRAIVNRLAPSAASGSTESFRAAPTTEDYLQTMAAQLGACAKNIIMQEQINERVVSRLLSLESKFKQLERKMQTLISTGGLGRQPSVYIGNNIVLTRVLGRFKMLVDTRELLGVSGLIVDGHLDMTTTDYLEGVLTPEMSVLEIGAGIGYYTLVMAAAVGATGRVHATESNAKNLELLDKNLDGNGFSPRFGYDVHTHATTVPNAQLIEQLGERPLHLIKVGTTDFTSETLETLRMLSAQTPTLQCVVDFSLAFFRDAGIDPAALFAKLRRNGFVAKLLGLRATFDSAWDGDSVPGAASGSIVLARI